MDAPPLLFSRFAACAGRLPPAPPMRTLMVSPAFRLKSRLGADEIEDAADEEEAVELDESECSSFGMRCRLGVGG